VAVSEYLSDASIRPLPRPHRPGDDMKAIVGLLVVVAVAVGPGCAKQDWIDRTLVTVDVTGTWRGSPGGPGTQNPGALFLDLRQEGATVQGFIRQGASGAASSLDGPISGTVAGDVFRFSSTRGIAEGELTVNGDEMSGTVSIGGTRQLTLRRVDPSSPPASPPR
jgi:hypothetical protein